MFYSAKKQKGFTILELLIAVFVVSIGLVAVYSTASQIIADTNLTMSRLTAAYLVQEGIEVVRNIRDRNLLNQDPWNLGLLGCGGGRYAVGYYNSTLSCYNVGEGDPYLYINADGYYGANGNKTKFKRIITIDNTTYSPGGLNDSGDKILKVTARIEWQEKGKTYNIEAIEYLYDLTN